MKKIDIIISIYLLSIVFYVVFLLLAGRIDKFLYAGSLAIIPLVFAILSRRRISSA